MAYRILFNMHDSPTESLSSDPKEGLSLFRIVLFALAIGALVFALFGVPPSLEVGSPAPMLKVQSYDGQSWDISRFKGQPMVINFWATWCAPCLHEMPAFSDVARKNTDIVFLGAAVRSDKHEVLEVVRRMNIPYLIAAADDSAASAFGASALPTTVFLNDKHEVQYVQVGAISKKRLLTLMKKHLR